MSISLLLPALILTAIGCKNTRLPNFGLENNDTGDTAQIPSEEESDNWPSVGNAGNVRFSTYQSNLLLEDLGIHQIDLEGPIQWFSPIILSDIGITNEESGLASYDLATGERLDFFTTKNTVVGTPAVAVKERRLLAGDKGGNLFLLNVSAVGEFQSIWEFLGSEDTPFFSRPVVDENNNGAIGFIGDNQGNVFALDLLRDSYAAALKWQTQFDSVDLISSVYTSLALSSDAVFVVTRFGGLYKLDKETGKIVWHFPLPAGTTSYSSPTLDESLGRVYFGRNCGETPAIEECGEVYVVDIETGEEVCSLAVEGGDVRTPLTIGSDGAYFSNAMTGELYKMDKENCEVIWQTFPGDLAPVGDTTTVLVKNDDEENLLLLRDQNNSTYLLVVAADSGDLRYLYELSEQSFMCGVDPGKSCVGIAVANRRVVINGGGQVHILQ